MPLDLIHDNDVDVWYSYVRPRVHCTYNGYTRCLTFDTLHCCNYVSCPFPYSIQLFLDMKFIDIVAYYTHRPSHVGLLQSNTQFIMFM